MRSIIVTGGFGILGRAVAQAFREQRDRVARIDFAPDAVDDNPGGLDIGGIDLTDAAAAADVVARVTDTFGGIDVLVNVAGGFVWEPLVDGGPQTWARMYAMNAVTCVTMTKAALPVLSATAGAAIVNIGAGSALVAGAGMGGYAASKAAVHALTQSLAAELADVDCTVNAVLPSIIDTPTNRADMPDADVAQWVQPASLAKVIVFLASAGARNISGALIPVSRGG
ncbi:NAD(P)-dependent dehydrogenase (short-subunit alcohol dehydrogenase family) [Novosphingobium hassiacum]|uniref:NAD(P)-dependent dehydrogenase (Short-subunit alcohol dehydrogenase family) n=1 Tax=Novosphingobium hassiacum TaxID=173676 RepID=A0A7W5ZWX9_9SPHN|nr:SDR family NAD(P)-dependent oxidoreductase [Novosphingobium hassiacum]MBB3860009.1 NAD(P)-dependent dehydrogenase (short-subunit alcohol dehydrogenase family) [Novosphingobium hassiacum]